ncbi:hypothetical protein [Mycolicibacterium sarraceniae]|uniref:PASTA domain-containing protein n=1 Tax=Mycolicibacterium sarraceniae TaxID=1534348 RepID=A0A7I7SP56_9MYCO|nr:hypothetical protein [Mycolicibacterium sarraceniae]BBY57626.1 hypothetical protein MSAR_07620 [Mycolicibacterium sarraceniae]
MVRIRTVFAVTPVAIAAALASAAVAHASSPNVVGKTFDEANSTLSSSGYTAVVVSTLGERTKRGDCVVTRQQDRQTSNGRQTLLALDCDAPLAAAGVPGNSAASPAGRAAAAAQVTKVSKADIEAALVSQLATQPGPAWAQCSDGLVGTIGSSIDCTVLADHEKHAYTVTVSEVNDGRVSYSLELKS